MVPTTRTGVRLVPLPSGEAVPALGQGTWHLAEGLHPPEEELAALRLGLDLGLTLVDTAEMYADGAAEELVGRAITGRRDEVFLVSKVLPGRATRQGIAAACEASLRRLGTDRLDLYLLHWRGPVPLDETVAGFEDLRTRGLIRHWGVSNFDLDLMQELMGEAGGAAVQTNQVLYNLSQRGIEWDLLPWLRQHRIPVMAYSPMDEGRLLRTRAMTVFAKKHEMTPAQVAIAWLLAQDGVIAIPKTGNRARLEENAGALAHPLTTAQLAELDLLFPPPTGPTPLAMI
jgi:diketogulonate reductase-like aldo/keto reductase